MDNLKVLVVDDEPGIRLGITRVLQPFLVRVPESEIDVGFSIAQAESGEEAIAHLRAQPVDILLLDHKLPGISGLDVLEWVAAEPRDWLTVMITAYATIETAVSATKRGAFDFLAKPFTPEELKATVAKTARHLLLQREAKRLADEKRQVRFQLISVLAHELKAPLAAVEGYLQLLRDGVVAPGSPKAAEVLGRSLERIEGMRKLIVDILDLTRIESGQKKRELVEVDVREAAFRAIETATPAARSRQVTIELSAPERLGMRADPGELDIMFNNLVSNAVKYNRDGGRVEVRLADLGDRVRIEVADTGIGMSPEELKQLFGEFVRIKNAKTRTIQGSGLGLSILKKLAALYGGDVSVESTPDVGSTFTVTLQKQ
ncbi:MAG TPA: ATP-binding protein [Thermoanaerobaculaceae bacterium]|nr:ATP-binding protein [Thermoanaerobaculaceae bacterium]HRS15509.1 ATP-binding protein [Thermoanaerobaculaceae bacterium]